MSGGVKGLGSRGRNGVRGKVVGGEDGDEETRKTSMKIRGFFFLRVFFSFFFF